MAPDRSPEGVRRTVPGTHLGRHRAVLEVSADIVARPPAHPVPSGTHMSPACETSRPGRYIRGGRRAEIRRLDGAARGDGRRERASRGLVRHVGPDAGDRRGNGLGPVRLAGISADLAYGVSPTVDLGGRL